MIESNTQTYELQEEFPNKHVHELCLMSSHQQTKLLFSIINSTIELKKMFPISCGQIIYCSYSQCKGQFVIPGCYLAVGKEELFREKKCKCNARIQSQTSNNYTFKAIYFNGVIGLTILSWVISCKERKYLSIPTGKKSFLFNNCFPFCYQFSEIPALGLLAAQSFSIVRWEVYKLNK